MVQLNQNELEIIKDAAAELAFKILSADDEDISELNNYFDKEHDKGMPVSIDVKFDDDEEIEEINVEIGHHDGYEWSTVGKSIESAQNSSRSDLICEIEDDNIDAAIANAIDLL